MVLAPRDHLLFLKDLQYSARTLARSPGVALALVLTIALGIGTNAAVHGFVRGLMRPPPGTIERAVDIKANRVPSSRTRSVAGVRAGSQQCADETVH